MKKNKKIYLKKIVAVLVLLSVLSSLLVVVSSASNVTVNGKNERVVPYFNPIGITCRYLYGNTYDTYNYAFGGDFYAQLSTEGYNYGFSSDTGFYDDGTDTWRNLKRYNDVTFYPASSDRPSYWTWGAQFYSDSVNTCLYNTYQDWLIDDFVYSDDFYYNYSTPFLRIGLDPNTPHSSYFVVEYYYTITYYDKLSKELVHKNIYGSDARNMVDVIDHSIDIKLVDRLNIRSNIGLLNADYAYISNFRCSFYDPNTLPYVSSEAPRINSMSIHSLVDDNGYYPDIGDFERDMIGQFELPDNVEVSNWLVSGIKGFMDTPLFGPLSVGMIFLSIFGFWFLIMFLKKFAGG